ncbi:MAG: hypothetical protein EHM36_02440, partial [Deltaproteobacteria bacterium]
MGREDTSRSGLPAIQHPSSIQSRNGTPLVLSQAAPSAAVTYGGRDGSSIEKAVVIRGVKDTLSGIRAERQWLAKHYPGYKKVRQSLFHKDERSYDLIEISTAAGEAREIYFD